MHSYLAKLGTNTSARSFLRLEDAVLILKLD